MVPSAQELHRKGSASHQSHGRTRSGQIQLTGRSHPYGSSSGMVPVTNGWSHVGPSSSESVSLRGVSRPSSQYDVSLYRQSELQRASTFSSSGPHHSRRSSYISLDHRYPMLPLPGEQYRQRSPESHSQVGVAQRPRPQSTLLSSYRSPSPTQRHRRNNSSSTIAGPPPPLRTLPPSRLLDVFSQFPESGGIRLPPIQFPGSPSLPLQSFQQQQQSGPLGTTDRPPDTAGDYSYSSRASPVTSPQRLQPPVATRTDPRYRYSLPSFTFPPTQTSSHQSQRHSSESSDEEIDT